MRFRNVLIALMSAMFFALVPATSALADPSGPTGLPPGSPALTSCPMLSLRSTGDCVKSLQEGLHLTGVGLTVDGIYGPQTKAAVVAFQQFHGLTVDGIAGPQTLGTLEQVLSNPQPAPVTTNTVKGAEPDGLVLAGGVWKCGTVTCALYFDQETTNALADSLNEHQMKNALTSESVCTRIGFKSPLAGTACGFADAFGSNHLQDKANKAKADSGCLEVRVLMDPMVPVSLTTSNGRNCLAKAI